MQHSGEQPHAEEAFIKEVSMKEAVGKSELLPRSFFEEFGERATQMVLGGRGDIEVMVGERGEMVLPDTKAIVFTEENLPAIEMLLRQPWGSVAKNSDAYWTILLQPDNPQDEWRGATGTERVWGERDEGIRVEKQKGPGIVWDRILDGKGEVKPEPEREGGKNNQWKDSPHRMFGTAKALVAAGIKRGLLKDADTGDPISLGDDFSVRGLSPNEVRDLYERIYKTSSVVRDVTGTGIVGASAHQSTENPENLVIAQEGGFTARVTEPDDIGLESVLPESVSLGAEYVGPLAQKINETVRQARFEGARNWYSEINTSGTEPNSPTLVGTLLYKGRPGERVRPNLRPVVLSPQLCIFRGSLGQVEDTVVAVNVRGEWHARMFGRSNQTDRRVLGDRIDEWVQELEAN